MRVKPYISLANQFAVESPFSNARFISSHEQNGFSLWIKGEGHTPYSIRRVEPQLFHVRVLGVVQGVNSRAAQLRPELLKESRQSQDLRLNVLVQLIELRLELISDLNNPAHP